MTQHYRYRLDIQRVQDGVCFPGDVLPENILQTFRDQAIFLGQRRGVSARTPERRSPRRSRSSPRT